MPIDNIPCPNIIPIDHYTMSGIAALKNIIAEADSPVMVVYRTTEECHFLLKEIKGSCYYDGTEAMLRKWNEQKLPVMLIHPRRAVGTDFSDGGHIIAWFSSPTSIADYQQTNARLVRIGQKHDVTIHHIMDENVPDFGWDLRLKPEDLASENAEETDATADD